MARWKLTEPHYLNVPTERWEHTTNDSRTGKPVRKMYKVPKHLDPRIEDDWNVRFPNNAMDGEIHVCHVGKGNPGDIEFEGDPTPGMLPLDDEARAITAKFDWTPTQGIDEDSQRASFYNRLTDKLFSQLDDIRAKTQLAPQSAGLDKLLEAMAAMMAQNQQLMTLLAGKAAATAPLDELERQAKELGEVRPDETDQERLEMVEPTEEEIAEATRAAAEREAASAARAHARMTQRRI